MLLSEAVSNQFKLILGSRSWRHVKCQLAVVLFANTQTWAFPAPERQNHKKIMSCHNPPDRRSNSHKQTVSGRASFFRPFFATSSRESLAMIAVPTFDGQHLMRRANTFLAKYKSACSTFLLHLLSTGRPKFSRGILNGYESHLMPIVHCTVVEENC